MADLNVVYASLLKCFISTRNISITTAILTCLLKKNRIIRDNVPRPQFRLSSHYHAASLRDFINSKQGTNFFISYFQNLLSMVRFSYTTVCKRTKCNFKKKISLNTNVFNGLLHFVFTKKNELCIILYPILLIC